MVKAGRMSEATATPIVKRGQHKPDCKCGWCQTKRRNLEKKTAAVSDPENAGASSPAVSVSGESSAPSSPPKPATPAPQPAATKAPTMRAKVAKMAAQRTPTTASDDPKLKPAATAAAQASAPRSDWFAKLFSGPTTFFDQA